MEINAQAVRIRRRGKCDFEREFFRLSYNDYRSRFFFKIEKDNFH